MAAVATIATIKNAAAASPPMDEFALIRRYFSAITDAADKDILRGVGDDAAVLALDDERALVVAADTCVMGTHFPPATPPFAIGFKSLAVNLSDLAAMAARPRWCTLALSLPEPCRRPAWLAEFRRGFAAVAERHKVSLVGGDTCAADTLSITAQIIGTARREELVYRSGARPGDDVYVSGELGAAAYVLRRLRETAPPSELPADEAGLLDRLYAPQPQVETGLKLAGKASAMIDLSDGLLADLGHILDAGRVGAVIHLEDIPIHPVLRRRLAAEDLWRCALAGGDDYQLCFTTALSPSRIKAALGETKAHRIGEITNGGGLWVLREDGSRFMLEERGYRHF